VTNAAAFVLAVLRVTRCLASAFFSAEVSLVLVVLAAGDLALAAGDLAFLSLVVVFAFLAGDLAFFAGDFFAGDFFAGDFAFFAREATLLVSASFHAVC